tara:strand:+ start:141 stop:341 length:201 start_codon:yes stop_codon:yes gene_type:complete
MGSNQADDTSTQRKPTTLATVGSDSHNYNGVYAGQAEPPEGKDDEDYENDFVDVTDQTPPEERKSK